MAEPISIQQLKDASEDAISLADFINKPENVMIPRRLASDINSLQYYLEYMKSYSQKSYETYDEMLSNASNLSENVSVFVTNDADTSKNGIYTYNGTSFVKGEYQPENAAKEFVEAKLDGLQVFNGKVRAQDVSTADDSTQAIKNTEFRNELDALPFVEGVLPDSSVSVEEQLIGGGELTLKDFNKISLFTVSGIAELLKVKPSDGRSVFVKGLQGGTFFYDSTKSAINDGGYIFNGWVRKLDYSKVTPEMFGAKGDGITDDADAIRKCVASCLTNKIKSIIFSRSYLIDTPRIVGQETLLIMSPNISYVGVGGTEFIVGDNIPDKFIIFGAVHNIITTPDVGNVIVSGIKFRAKSAAANMNIYSSNLAIHTYGLNNVWIEKCTFDELDLSNVIASGIRYEGVSYGSKVVVDSNKFLSVVAENVVNEDHSTIYMEAPDSFITNNTFKSSTLQTRKVACGVEVHASNVMTSGNTLSGYSRFCWLASFPDTITNSHFINNTALISNHFLILSASATHSVYKCSVRNNYIRCEHATSDSNFVTYQGIAVTSGKLDGIGWTPISEVTLVNNVLCIDYSVDQKFSTIVNLDEDAYVDVVSNRIYNAISGINTNVASASQFVDNHVFNQNNSRATTKDFFIAIRATSISGANIADNKFYFTATNKPAYLVGLFNATADGLSLSTIINNTYGTTHKPQADLYYQTTLKLAGNGNKLNIGFYNVPINIPALTSGGDVSYTQNIPNNVNGMIVELNIIPESRFYPLVDKGVAVDSGIDVRIKALTSSAAINTTALNVRVKTK